MIDFFDATAGTVEFSGDTISLEGPRHTDNTEEMLSICNSDEIPGFLFGLHMPEYHSVVMRTTTEQGREIARAILLLADLIDRDNQEDEDGK